MPSVAHQRGDFADFVTLAGSSGLVTGQHYNIQDTNQIAVATSASAYYLVGGVKHSAYFTNSNTGNVTGLNTALTTLTLDTEKIDTGNLFTISANRVTANLNETTSFKVSAGAYLNDGTTARTEHGCWIYKNGTIINDSIFVFYLRGYDSGMSEDGFTVLDIEDGDIFDIRTDKTDGGTSAAYQEPYATFLLFEQQ